MDYNYYMQLAQLTATIEILEINKRNEQANKKTAELLQEILNQLKKLNGKD